MIKRYVFVIDDRWPNVAPPDIIESERDDEIIGFADSTIDGFGEWVKYDDIKHLLERSDNSDYAVTPTASPKFPSLEEVKNEAKKYDRKCPEWAISATYFAIKKLGNFT